MDWFLPPDHQEHDGHREGQGFLSGGGGDQGAGGHHQPDPVLRSRGNEAQHGDDGMALWLEAKRGPSSLEDFYQ